MICLYYGPITSKGQLSIGGYEAANRKNIDKLRSLGIQVKEYPNPVINKKLGCFGKIVYIKLLSSAMNLLKYKKRSDVVVHITPLYNYLLFHQCLLFGWLNFAGCQVSWIYVQVLLFTIMSIRDIGIRNW